MLNTIKDTDYMFHDFDFFKWGKKFLGITEVQAMNLFNTSDWPEQFATVNGIEFDDLPFKRQAAIAAKRIEHFIKTGE